MNPEYDRQRELKPDRRNAGVYVREGDAHIGPFATLLDARSFIELIEAFGEDTEGIEVVEIGGNESEPDRRYCCH